MKPSSQLLAIASAGAIVIYEPASGIMVKRLIGHAGTWCNTLQFIDDDTIVSVGSTGKVHVQRISDGTFLHRFDVGRAARGAFSSDGKRVVVGDTGCRISEWDIETGSPVMDWTKVHSQHVRALAYLPGSYIYISGDAAGEVRLWRAGAQVSFPEVAREKTARDRIAELEEALRVRPDWAKGHEQLALLYYEEGDALNMFRHFHAASQSDPNLNTPHKYLRNIYAALGRSEDVEREIFEDRRTNRPSPTVLVSEVRHRLSQMTLAHHREMAALAEELQTKVTVVEKSIPVVEGKPVVWRAHQDRVRSVAFLPGGQGLVSGSSDRTINNP